MCAREQVREAQVFPILPLTSPPPCLGSAVPAAQTRLPSVLTLLVCLSVFRSDAAFFRKESLISPNQHLLSDPLP